MRRFTAILVLLLAGLSAHAQYSDARLWAGASVRWNATKKLRFTLEEEVRLFGNISRLDKLNTEITAGYRFGGLLEIGLLYRLIASYEPLGYFSTGHRLAVYLGLEENIYGWDCSVKGSFQETFGAPYRSENWELPEKYVRMEAEIAHVLFTKKTEPFVNLELWCRVATGDPAFIDQYRLTAGVQYKLNKRNRVDLFYRLQQELQVNNPLTGHIIGAGYRYYIR